MGDEQRMTVQKVSWKLAERPNWWPFCHASVTRCRFPAMNHARWRR